MSLRNPERQRQERQQRRSGVTITVSLSSLLLLLCLLQTCSASLPPSRHAINQGNEGYVDGGKSSGETYAPAMGSENTQEEAGGAFQHGVSNLMERHLLATADTGSGTGNHDFLSGGQIALFSDEYWIFWGVACGLVLFAGLMSGLTMGLMSMDTMNLEILINSGTPVNASYASRILPLVRHHHLLLVTLLIANAAAMEMLPIFLDRVVGPIPAIVLSITAVLFFGEIIPQALCTRYGLAIGANLAWFVWIIIALTFVVSWPISKLLDCILGAGEHGTFYRRAELKELVGFHHMSHDVGEDMKDSLKQQNKHFAEGEGLTMDEVQIIKGALDMRTKTVGTTMTPVDKVIMVDFDASLDRNIIEKMAEAGHSRFPVYRQSRDNIIGILLVKMIWAEEHAKGKKIADLALRRAPTVGSNMPLYDMLHLFSQGKSHMAIVLDVKDHITPVGVITLEDVLEELIQWEIVDETDVYEDVAKQVRVAQAILPDYGDVSHYSITMMHGEEDTALGHRTLRNNTTTTTTTKSPPGSKIMGGAPAATPVTASVRFTPSNTLAPARVHQASRQLLNKAAKINTSRANVDRGRPKRRDSDPPQNHGIQAASSGGSGIGSGFARFGPGDRHSGSGGPSASNVGEDTPLFLSQ
eukprot:TRINITY_DN994_c0_g1_i2.p1 TRINITY_DN994_c0_g1~~TRINITY_DN994_c0_g1_i2.p1  ORF type:complete len:660 (-),score=148.71 TRINITY_DN994_c0_g1_i2:31-1950(-)